MAASAWFSCAKSRPDARLKLLCFPYAGGGAHMYRSWAAALPTSIEIWLVHLPGREHRICEPPINSLSTLVAALNQELGSLLAEPAAFFGHSMGALVAFELARFRQGRGNPLPRQLILSGHQAPHLPSDQRPIHMLPDAEFIEQIGSFDGTPRSLLDDRRIMKVLLPQLRADFRAIETYRYVNGPPIPIPITIFGGSDDPHVDASRLDEWHRHSTARCRLKIFEGGHFYLHERRAHLLSQIASELDRFA